MSWLLGLVVLGVLGGLAYWFITKKSDVVVDGSVEKPVGGSTVDKPPSV
jgi:hypothetical protein